MPQDKYNIELTLCPFVKEIGARSIRCEGCMPDATVTQFFRTSRDKLEYKRNYCDTWKHKSCAIYRVADAKYDEHGNLLPFMVTVP